MKSASHSIISTRVFQGGAVSAISALVYQEDETSVISPWVYEREKTSVISARVNQKGQRTKENRSKCGQRTLLHASDSSPLPSPIFPVTFKHHIFPAFEHYSFLRPPSQVYRTTHIYLRGPDRNPPPPRRVRFSQAHTLFIEWR